MKLTPDSRFYLSSINLKTLGIIYENVRNCLMEMPKHIGNWDFPFADDDENKGEVRSILSDSRLHEMHIDGVRITEPNTKLVKAGNRIALVDFNSHTMFYYVKFEADGKISKELKGVSNVCQVGVWSNPIHPDTHNLANNIFFNYFLKEYDVIVTDVQQSYLGERFWLSRIHHAFSKGLSIYYIDNMPPTSAIQLHSYKHFVDISIEKKLWSDDDRSKNKKVIITR